MSDSDNTERYDEEVTEVAEAFKPEGKCVDCPHSNGSWCRKQGRWGYDIQDCEGNKPVAKKEKSTEPKKSTAWNAKEVICTTTGQKHDSLAIAARFYKLSNAHLRHVINGKRTFGKMQFAFVGGNNE